MERTARRVLGGAHPTTLGTESNLRNARRLPPYIWRRASAARCVGNGYLKLEGEEAPKTERVHLDAPVAVLVAALGVDREPPRPGEAPRLNARRVDLVPLDRARRGRRLPAQRETRGAAPPAGPFATRAPALVSAVALEAAL